MNLIFRELNIEQKMYNFAIDRGGTFTDVLVQEPSGAVKVMKLLSVNPEYPDAPREAIRRVLNTPSHG